MGFVAADVPKIAVALVMDQRGRRVGGRLLAALIDAAAISTKAGFVRAGGDDDSPTILLELGPGA